MRGINHGTPADHPDVKLKLKVRGGHRSLTPTSGKDSFHSHHRASP